MDCYGLWKIRDKDIIGNLSINEKNKIFLTLDDIERTLSELPVIYGKTNNGNAILLDNRMTEILPLKTKYFSNYAIFLKKGNFELININTRYFEVKYKLPNLEQWLNFLKFENLYYDNENFEYNNNLLEKDNIIKLVSIENILLINDDNIKIYIQFEKGINRYLVEENKNLNSFYYEPYIHIEYKKPKKLEEIDQDILMINRFFALMIGFAEEIPYYFVYLNDGSYKNEIQVYTRFCFSVNTEYRQAYKYNEFIKYSKIKNDINILFSNWYKLYKNEEYRMIFNFYFLPNIVEEEKYLNVCKSLESLYNIKNMVYRDEIENKEVIKEINDILFNNSNIKQELNDFLVKNKLSSQKKHAKKFTDDIPKVILSYFYNRYLVKITFGKKIQEFDELKIYEDNFCINDIYNPKKDIDNNYDYAGNTRNYLTHLSKVDATFKEEFVVKYSMIINLIFLNELFKDLEISEENRKKIILNKNSYMMINIKYKSIEES